MKKRVEIIEKFQVFKRFFFRIEEAQVRHELYNGEMSPVLTRLKFDRGDSVAILMHDSTDDTIFLTEQFRFPTYDPEGKRGDGWLVEIPAGSVDDGEDPARTVLREVQEESGYTLRDVKLISTFYLSPGGLSERILLYYARVNPRQKTTEGGGKADEGEDIRVFKLPVAEAYEQVKSGKLNDAKTIIGIQWIWMKVNGLVKS